MRGRELWAADVAISSAAIPAMKKRVIVVSGLSLAVFARRILCWQDEAISHTVAVTWLLCNRRCSVEHSATVYSSARLQLLVPRLGYGREHTAISIFAYPPLALSLLAGTAPQHRLEITFSSPPRLSASVFPHGCRIASTRYPFAGLFCTLRFDIDPSSSRDICISPNLIRTQRKRTDLQAFSLHLLIAHLRPYSRPGASHRLIEASSLVFSSEIHPTSVEWDTSVP
jgi:hypothetical protein